MIGAGQVNWPSLLALAPKAGVKLFYIEDEHPHAEAQMPESLRYLATI